MKSKRKRLPPQPKLMSHKAEANKSLVIGIIAVIAIVGLGLLLFFSKQFVGKAIHYVPPGENQAGFFITSDSTAEVGKMFVLPVTVKIGSGQSVAGSFEFTYPANLLDVDCASIFKEVDSVFIVDGNDLSVFKNNSCENGKVSWQFAGLCDETCSNALSPGKSIDIAKIRFYPKHAGQVKLDFTSFDIIDLDTESDLIAEGNNASFSIIAKVLGTTCGDGKVDAGESCDDGNTVNSDGCSAVCQVESGWNCVGVPSKCCSDSDGGYNLSIKGWAIGASEIISSFGKYNDSCTNQTSIVEMTCTSGNFVRANTQECPGGKSCSDGACIAAFCPAGKECCGGTTEINLQTDVNNCGACGIKCSGSASICSAGKCVECTSNATCSLGYTCQNSVCTSPLGALLVVEEVDPSNTKIKALADINQSFYVYTTLKDGEGIILSFKKEIIVSMKKNEVYTTTATYKTPANITKKILEITDTKNPATEKVALSFVKEYNT